MDMLLELIKVLPLWARVLAYGFLALCGIVAFFACLGAGLGEKKYHEPDK